MSIKHSQNFGITGPIISDDFKTVGADARISRIAVNFADIVDGLTITYETSTDTKVLKHGGTGGSQAVFDLSPSEVVVGVYGTTGHTSPPYGASNITSLQFVILDKNNSNVRFQGTFGRLHADRPFATTGEIVSFASSGDGSFIQGISFRYRDN